MAVALSFRKKERTLTDAEVDASQAAVIAALQGELQAEVRPLDETLGSFLASHLAFGPKVCLPNQTSIWGQASP
jgi:hypothetical protein